MVDPKCTEAGFSNLYGESSPQGDGHAVATSR
jgi:hypothetical protein